MSEPTLTLEITENEEAWLYLGLQGLEHYFATVLGDPLVREDIVEIAALRQRLEDMAEAFCELDPDGGIDWSLPPGDTDEDTD